METIGTRIKNLRKKNNLTQEQLGNKLFFSGKTIFSWESNRTKPDLNALRKLSEIFHTPINYLLYGDNETKTFENEIKIRLTKDEYLRILYEVSKVGTLINDVTQIDTYYILTAPNKWLRIRQVGNVSTLSYKEITEFNTEKYEVSIDNLDNLNHILSKLGFNSQVNVFKKRITYQYNNYEFSFDTVENLGLFLEIEAIQSSNYDDLISITKNFSIDLNKIETQKYCELVMKQSL